MNLPLDIVRTTGRAAQALEVEMLRPLCEADLALLSVEKGSKPAKLVKIRDRHHAVARLLAAGKKPGEVAAICGYDVSRISIFQDDPAFRELLNFYRADMNAQYADVYEQMAGLSLDATILLRERIEGDPDSVSITQALAILEKTADRTGNGPKSTQDVNVNVNLADRLEAARKRIASRTIELTANAD